MKLFPIKYGGHAFFEFPKPSVYGGFLVLHVNRGRERIELRALVPGIITKNNLSSGTGGFSCIGSSKTDTSLPMIKASASFVFGAAQLFVVVACTI